MYRDVFFSKIFKEKTIVKTFGRKSLFLGFLLYLQKESEINLDIRMVELYPIVSQYRYENLAFEVVVEGLSLCNEIKLKRQLKKQPSNRPSGDFRQQFGYEELEDLLKRKKTQTQPLSLKYFEKTSISLHTANS